MRRYYNDNDGRVCEWLRELIRQGHLPPGDIDERSISDVQAQDLKGYDQCHFFVGIGGWPLAIRWAGLEETRGIWTGSCPCQPFSCAGRRKGHLDRRHLWPAFFGLIDAIRPSVVFGEQVASADAVGKVGRGAQGRAGKVWFDGVRADLEGTGYAVGAAILGAHSVGAPHRRQRLYWLAQSISQRWGGWCDGNTTGVRGEIQTARRGATGGMADMQRTGLEGFGGHGDGRHEPGWNNPEAVGHAAEGGATGRVANAKRPEWRSIKSKHERNGDDARWYEAAGRSGTRCAAGGMADSPDTDRRPGKRKEKEGTWQDGERWRGFGIGGATGWTKYDILPCRDGKARRVESGTFPLADGVPGRVGLLRGYGNAIVPACAQAFIEAWKETL